MSLEQLDRTSSLPALRFPLPQLTRRLRIRPFKPADADAIFAIHGDSEATRYMTGPLSREASLANLSALIDRVESTGYGPYAVELRDSPTVLGWAGVQQVPPRNAPSIAVLRKLGFSYDRPFTHKLVDCHGHLYRVTREAFERARLALSPS